MKLAFIAAALLPAALMAQDQCFENYRCIFHHNVGSTEYSWDMHSLCRGVGQDYSYTDEKGHVLTFNICGNSSTVCAPKYPQYDSTGVAVQKWGADPTACDMSCTNYDTGAPTCCTGDCAVVGTEFFRFQLIDESNPLTGGVAFVHPGMPPDPADPFECPNGANNLPRERQLTVKIYCDEGGSPSSLKIIGLSEPTVCQYVLETSSNAACGVKGDPYDGFRDYPPHSFGFVVLGAFLTILCWGVYRFGSGRGWWDCITRRLPQLGRSGGSSTGPYKNISTGSTPITASAYGST